MSEENKISICSDCESFGDWDEDVDFYICENEETKATEFIYGYTDCKIQNPDGKCPYFNFEEETEEVEEETKSEEEIEKIDTKSENNYPTFKDFDKPKKGIFGFLKNK